MDKELGTFNLGREIKNLSIVWVKINFETVAYQTLIHILYNFIRGCRKYLVFLLMHLECLVIILFSSWYSVFYVDSAMMSFWRAFWNKFLEYALTRAADNIQSCRNFLVTLNFSDVRFLLFVKVGHNSYVFYSTFNMRNHRTLSQNDITNRQPLKYKRIQVCLVNIRKHFEINTADNISHVKNHEEIEDLLWRLDQMNQS